MGVLMTCIISVVGIIIIPTEKKCSFVDTMLNLILGRLICVLRTHPSGDV